MADLSLCVAAACSICGSETDLDGVGRCRECVEFAHHRAIALDELEGALENALERGLRVEHIRQAVDLALEDQEGSITGDVVGRDRAETSSGTAPVWRLTEPSEFLEEDSPNRLRRLRQASGLSQRQLAELVGVAVEKIEGWERELRPDTIWPKHIEALTGVFGVTGRHLVGEDD